jgi:hypothetical protein
MEKNSLGTLTMEPYKFMKELFGYFRNPSIKKCKKHTFVWHLFSNRQLPLFTHTMIPSKRNAVINTDNSVVSPGHG